MAEAACTTLARRKLATEVDGLLTVLAGELEVANNPHQLARRALGVTPEGWTKVPYNKEAFRAWSDLLRRNPHDVDAMHHLAIMHHARAFDLDCIRCTISPFSLSAIPDSSCTTKNRVLC